MEPLINTTPGQRGLTPEGKEAFRLAYTSTGILESEYRPIVRFPREAAEIIRTVSALRCRDWRTTARWNAEADYTGLLGELAVQSYLHFPAETAMAGFELGLIGSDGGYDVEVDGLKLDVKATKGDALRFKFNKTNRHTKIADGFIFNYVEQAGPEVWVSLLGWARRDEIRPWLRDDGQRLFVRAETLRREGVLKPANLLKTESNIHKIVTTQA